MFVRVVIAVMYCCLMSTALADADLAVSSYTSDPANTSIPNGTVVDFEIRVTNLGPDLVSDAVLDISVASSTEVLTPPGGCILSGTFPAQTLSCTLSALADQAFTILTYSATARTPSINNTSATVSSVAVTDPVGGNDSEALTLTILTAGDLTVAKVASVGSVPAGSVISYTLSPNNAGPDDHDSVRVADTLPPLSEFAFQSVSAPNWSCSHSSAVVTCDYTGGAVTGTIGDITITGQIVSQSTGTISNIASIESTNFAILDPNLSNDNSALVPVIVTTGTDLVAGKSMPATVVVGEAANVTLSITNAGPMVLPAGSSIVDTFSPNLTITMVPPGCVQVAQTVTCTAGVLAASGAGATTNFVVGVVGASASSGIETNNATVTLPAGFANPNSANDMASANFTVVLPSADLAVTKTKTPDPVDAGATLTSTITIRNNGPSIASYAAGTPIEIIDTLNVGTGSSNETFLSSPTAGFSCAAVGNAVTCTTTGSGTIAVNATLVLTVLTQAGASVDENITNEACSTSSTHTPSDVIAGNDCDSATSRATVETADLAIVKDISLSAAGPWADSGTVLATSDASYFVRLRVTNNEILGGSRARAVNVADTLPNYINETITSPAGNVNLQTNIAVVVSPTNGSCNVPAASGAITCALSDVDPQETRTMILRVDRPFDSGVLITNTATISSPDTTDMNTANNSDSASFAVDPVADIVVNSKIVTPDPASTGAIARYVIDIKNVGANPAADVTLNDDVDESLFDAIANSQSTTKPGGSCTLNAVTAELDCSLGTFNRGQTFQASFDVRPTYPFGAASVPLDFPASYTNTASVTTTTVQAAGHQPDSESLTHDVNGPLIDLRVTKQEPDASFDPVMFGDLLVYDIRVSNGGTSRAGNVLIMDTPQPPAGYTMTLDSFLVNPVGADGGFTLYTPPNPDCDSSGVPIVCRLHSIDSAQNFLDPNQQTIFRLSFSTTGATLTGTLAFTNGVAVQADESGFDPLPSNNTASQSTSVLPRTDLEVVSKTRLGAPLRNINEVVDYEIVFRNIGASGTTQVRVTDSLPSGFVREGTPSVAAGGGSGASVSAITCSGANTVVCVIDGNFPAGAANTLTLSISAKALYPYTEALLASRTNTATIAVGQDSGGVPISRDPNSGNNSRTATTQIQAASISGTVYNDADRDDVVDAGEGLDAVTLTLSGTDIYGNNLSNIQAITGVNGNFTFGGLPPGLSYSVVETQPAGNFDRNEVAGTSGGVVDNSAYGVTAPFNSITGINLAAAASATGYLYQEYAEAAVSGFIYNDEDNNGTKAVTENGIDIAVGNEVQLTGLDYAGNVLSLTANLSGAGAYSFTELAPSDGTGYTVTQLIAASGFLDGLDENGSGVIIPNSAGRTLVNELIGPVVVDPGASVSNRNFGEITNSDLAGFVFLDLDSDAERDPGENTGFVGAVIRLTGSNDIGDSVDCLVTTTGIGAYSFPLSGDPDPSCQTLRPGTYALTETPPPGLVHTGAFIGSAGGTSGAQSGADTPAPGAANLAVTDIVVAAGTSAVNYNFGEIGDGLSGSVYLDSNNDGDRQPTEIGIPGITISLSGMTATAQDVCSVVSCDAVTDAAGNFSFPSLPGSDPTGYTLTQQPQANTPLSNYSDGQDAAGEVNGSTVGSSSNDVISNIVLDGTMLASNYRFGEQAASVTGIAYVDSNNDATVQAGEPRLEGISITLSGASASGADICTFLAALSPARSCTTTTAISTGVYEFVDLPAGTFTLTQVQPASYADGLETAGTPAGTTDPTPGVDTISSISLNPGENGVAYNFGERGASISGTVFKDVNRDGAISGVQDSGISGVTLTLRDASSNIIASVISGANGDYSFADLASGVYTVEETQPAGYESSSADTVAVTLTPGGTGSADFADTVSTLSGSVFLDANGNGLHELSEIGLVGVSIRLTGTDDAGNSIDVTVLTTAPNGDFIFDDLLSGSYDLAETQPSGYSDGNDSVGSAGGTLGNDTITSIALGAGLDAEDYAFGELGQVLQGATYVDENGNGTRDLGESGIPGVTVTLSGTNANGVDVCTFVTCAQVTDASGNYSYLNIPGSNATGYTLTQQTQATPPLVNYADGQDAAGQVAGSVRGAAGNDVITAIVINANEVATGYFFGELAIGLSGSVYSDSNDSGVQDAGEPGIPGVTVTLTGTLSTSQDVCVFLAALVPAQSCVVLTGSNGNYLFPDIPAGTYTLTETQPSDYLDGRENPGSPAGGVNNGSFGAGVATNQISAITLGPGQVGSGYTFGERGAVISGTVFKDTDRNGAEDGPSDPGIGGVTVQLRNSVGTVIATALTTADGSYSFTDLPQGDYTVEELQPLGYASSTPDSVAVTLVAAATAVIDFADTLSTVAAVVYLDINDDGVQQAGEPGLPGVEVILVGTDAAANPVNIALISAGDGTVVFVDVLAGTYSLVETHPVNFSDGTDVAGTAGGDVSDDRIDNIVVAAAVDVSGYLFGEGGQVISGTVYVDLNGNGLQDTNEVGIQGVTVELVAADTSVVETAVTDASGVYRIADAAAGDYTVRETQPNGYGSGPENASNTVPISIAVAVLNEPINFGETASSLAGLVFNDVNGNGIRDDNEPIIPSVDITLVGIDVRGDSVDITITSGIDGLFYFDGIVAGTYDLSQTQPIGFDDDADYAGSAGGTVGNDIITNIVVPQATTLSNYRFTESGNSGNIQGSIWRDGNHDRVRDGNEDPVAGWTVQLQLGDTVVQSATTGTDGGYQFSDVAPGSGYRLSFINPGNGATFGGARPNEQGTDFSDGVTDNNNPGGAILTLGGLTELTLLPGSTLAQQSLPLDPSGIVYDAVSRLPVEGAVVELLGPIGYDADLHLVGGSVNSSQTTGVDGLYQFLLFPSAPAGTYDLTLSAPVGAYNPVTPSSLIAVCPGTLNVGPTPNPLLIQSNAAPPPQGSAMDCAVGTNSTVYFLSFGIDPTTSAEILQNHLPVDPILEDALLVAKHSAKTFAVRGELVPYTITATNTLPGPLNDIQLIDRIPPGFRYRGGSARLDGVAIETQQRGNELVWSNINFAAQQTREISVLLVVGAATTEGNKTNYAFAFNVPADTRVSNVADATVRVVPDPNTDCTDVLGKVFNDKNANGYQDKGEPGLPSVRVVTVRGLLVTTDANGRYHIACPYIANETLGSNFIVKLDTRTLPTGFRVTTDNPHTVRLARGKFVKMNFGAANLPVTRIDVTRKAFWSDGVVDNLNHAIWQLIDQLENQPAVIRMAYTSYGESKKQVKQHLALLRKTIKRIWKKENRQQRLILEEEIIEVKVTQADTQLGDRQ